MLLDTASLYYRAFYGVPDTVTAPDGTPVNAVRGLLDMIARLVRAREPARLVACMDEDWRPAFRVEAVPSYKAHRVAQGNEEQTPDKLIPQVPIINDVLAATGLAVAGAKGYEADDVIATLATGAGQPVRLIGGHCLDPEGRAPVRVQAGHQGGGVPGPDQAAGHVEQPAYRVDRSPVRRADGVRHAVERAVVQRGGV